MKILKIAVFILAMGMIGCGRDGSKNNKPVNDSVENEIHTSVIKYLAESKGISVDGLNIQFSNLNVKDDTCLIDLAMGFPNEDPYIHYTYTLAKDNNTWKVVDSDNIGGGHTDMNVNYNMSENADTQDVTTTSPTTQEESKQPTSVKSNNK